MVAVQAHPQGMVATETAARVRLAALPRGDQVPADDRAPHTRTFLCDGDRNSCLSITNYQLPIPLLAALSLFIVRWIVQTAIINTSARRMGLKRFNMFSILWFDILLPLINLWMLIIPRKKLKW